MALESDTRKCSDHDMSIAGVQTSSRRLAVPPQFCANGCEYRFSSPSFDKGFVLVAPPIGKPERNQADDHAGGDGERKGD